MRLTKGLVLLLFALAVFGCRKDVHLPEADPFPFEDTHLRIERVTRNAPYNIRGLHFFSASTGVAVSYTGNIYRTGDGGSSWTQQYAVPIEDVPLHDLHFIDGSHGLAVGGSNGCGGIGCTPPGGSVYRTADGGITWTEEYNFPGEFVSVASNSAGEFFAVSRRLKGMIHKRSIGGQWNVVDSATFPIRRLSFHDGKGYCIGMHGNILESLDDGQTWALSNSFDGLFATDIKFVGSFVYCLVNDHAIYRSTDAATNWEIYHEYNSPTYSIQPLNDNDLLGFGYGPQEVGCFGIGSGGVRYTRDSGSNWSAIDLLNLGAIRYVHFYSSTEGYAVAGSDLLKISLK
jgi:photosystem II stability/assembly factor-like uncharacterized protein